MKYVVTDEDVELAVQMHDDESLADGDGASVIGMRAALESFSQTLGGPVADGESYRWLATHATINMDMGALSMTVQCSEESHGAKPLLDAAIDHMLYAAHHHPTKEKGCE